MRILGIDPGSRATGYGIIDPTPERTSLVISGCIRTETEHFPERLRQIYEAVYQISQEYRPTELAIEQVFAHKNVASALKLGHARGAAICGGMAAGLPVYEYAARAVKQALVGKGGAEKHQVQHMVRFLLHCRDELSLDASDALAVALCHLHHRQTAQYLDRMGVAPR